MICLVNSVNERDLSLLTSAVDLAANAFFRGTLCATGEEGTRFLSFPLSLGARVQVWSTGPGCARFSFFSGSQGFGGEEGRVRLTS